MKAGILGLIIIITSICIALYLIEKKIPSSQNNSSVKATLPARVKSYNNSVHQFSFSYPPSYHLSGNSNQTEIFISNQNESTFIFQTIATSSALSNKPVQYLLDLCKGGNRTTKCSVDSQAVVTSSSGVAGSSYYLIKNALASKKILGPFISFPLAVEPPYKAGFILFYPEELQLADSDKENFMMIANTFTLLVNESPSTPHSSSSAK